MTNPNSSCVILVPAFAAPVEKCEAGLKELERRGYLVRRVKGFSAIDQGRNQMASDALNDAFAETMWIDTDIGFTADGVDRLRSHNLPIVTGLYARPAARSLACEFLPGTETVVFGADGGLLEIKYAGAGFLHVRREAYETIRKQLDLPLCNTRFGRGVWPFFHPFAVELDSPIETQSAPVRHRYLTEDFAFCHRARQAGLKIMADTTIRLWRMGTYGYGWEEAGNDAERFDTYHFHVEQMASISDQFVPGGWADREVPIGPFIFKLLTPCDPDELLSHLQPPETASQPHFADPYWAKLWPAAPLLAEALVRSPPLRSTRVLELGCGSGLVGITALALGLDVTFSDYVPFAVDLALENAVRNGYPDATGLVLDWRDIDRLRCEPFSLILAADVTYDRTNIDPLLNVLEKLLAPIGEAWFGDAGRGPAEEFVRRAKQRGWCVSRCDACNQPIEEFVFGEFQRFMLRRR